MFFFLARVCEIILYLLITISCVIIYYFLGCHDNKLEHTQAHSVGPGHEAPIYALN